MLVCCFSLRSSSFFVPCLVAFFVSFIRLYLCHLAWGIAAYFQFMYSCEWMWMCYTFVRVWYVCIDECVWTSGINCMLCSVYALVMHQSWIQNNQIYYNVTFNTNETKLLTCCSGAMSLNGVLFVVADVFLSPLCALFYTSILSRFPKIIEKNNSIWISMEKCPFLLLFHSNSVANK